jgi:chromosome segregation ATPase
MLTMAVLTLTDVDCVLPPQGHMLVKEEAGTLTLMVKMNVIKDPHAKQVNDLKQLSGGERSTTTVAFFLALGGYVESPFRIMDEYDVFMDAVNRRHATQALLEYALDAPHLQFVLLTPQVRAPGCWDIVNLYCSCRR